MTFESSRMGAGVRQGHEPDRVSVRGVIWCVAGLLAVIAGTMTVVGLVAPGYHPDLLEASAVPDGPARRDWGEQGKEQLRRLREREAANLGASGWADAAHSAARIPIERAMEIIAARAAEQGKGGRQ